MRQEKNGWIKKAKNRIADITQKKIINSVISSLPLSEEKIRRYLADRNIPSEFVNFIIQQINASRKNLTDSIKEEIRKYISAINITDEIQRILSRMVIEIKTEIRLVPADRSRYKSNVKSTVSLRYDEEEKI